MFRSVTLWGIKTNPIELRQRIVDAVDQQLGAYKEIAEMFGVTERYIYELLRQRRETPSHAPLQRGGWAQAKLSEEHLLTLAEMAPRRPDATLEELRRQLHREIKVEVSISTVWRGLERIEFTQKKDQARARG
jgi:transposase